jgi:hypothetical protein
MRIVQWILAFVFAITAGLKLTVMVGSGVGGGAGAAVTLFNSQAVWLQWAVVAGELILAVWLATGWRGRWGAFSAIVLLSVFMGAVIVETGKPLPHPCGCFGALASGSVMRGLWITLSVDGVMLLGALWVYFRATRLPPKGAATGGS